MMPLALMITRSLNIMGCDLMTTLRLLQSEISFREVQDRSILGQALPPYQFQFCKFYFYYPICGLSLKLRGSP